MVFMPCELFLLNYDLFESVVLVALFFLFQLFIFKRIIRRINLKKPKKQSGQVVIGHVKHYFEGWGLKKTRFRALVIAVALAVLLDAVYFLVLHPIFGMGGEASITTSILFHPIWEEVFNRAIFMAGWIALIQILFFYLPKVSKTHASFCSVLEKALIVFVILVNGLSFGTMHGTFFQVLQGLLLGVLFLGDDLQKLLINSKKEVFGSRNNVVPAILAHAVHNFIVAAVCTSVLI